MTGSPGPPPGRRLARATGDRGWLLAGQILLGLAAALFLPLGARDSAGVSSILPPLHPSTEDISPGVTVQIDPMGHDGGHIGVRAVTPASPTPWTPPLPRHAPPLPVASDAPPPGAPSGSLGSRAPPSVP